MGLQTTTPEVNESIERDAPKLAPLIVLFCQDNDGGAMGFGNRPTGNGRMPDGYLEAGFPKPGSLERAVREERSGMSCLQ